ncbi:hypothetical protein [Rhizobium sp. SGZ-381]|uniref:hypothetical protein n=1 Tax=Rhizobium sp. SGZ-381 TaxID=3342800 RepID=UPI00366E8397
MRMLKHCLLLIFVLPLVACSPTRNAVDGDGAGYALLTPNAGTRAFMLREDDAFARQVAAHNLQCRNDALCAK